MKKYAFVICAALAVVGCSKQWNDLVHEEVVAQITAFSVEGQVSCTISKNKKAVDVVVPKDTDLTKLTVASFAITEGASCTPAIKVGDVLDLSSPLNLTLTTFDKYVWTLSASYEKEPEPQDGPQLYNMSFDNWSQEGLNKVWVCYGENATDAEKAIWASANGTTQPLGYVTVSPEDTFLAVSGEGKRALKLQTQGMSLLFDAIKKLAAGSIFNGYTGAIDIAKMSAKIYWGVSFKERPKVLEGYACYKPGTIDWTQDPYKEKAGQLDNGHIFVVLTDWDEPFEVSPPDKLLDLQDTHIIGYGKVVFDKNMEAYEPFKVNIEYRNERTPKYVAIVISSSALGDYFTGSASSVLYMDELKFTY